MDNNVSNAIQNLDYQETGNLTGLRHKRGGNGSLKDRYQT